jgi:putative oxidoreductase
MNQIRTYLLQLGRVLLVFVFLINGFGIVSPAMAIHEMTAKGIPVHLALLLSIAARIIDVVAGLCLILGIWRRFCALALIGFLIPATLIAHAFWSAPNAIFQIQLINFFKNLAIMGGLLLIAVSRRPIEHV